MVSFFADTVNANARQTSTITFITLASPCGDREIMHVVANPVAVRGLLDRKKIEEHLQSSNESSL